MTTDGATALIPAIDVSAWQDVVDWPAVAAHGVRVAFIKATEGASGEHSRDTRFATNVVGCAAAGIVAIPYAFFTAAPPEAQAQNFLAALTAAGCVPCAVMLDLERSDSPGTDFGARALTWIAAVEAALGCRPWVYLSPYFALGEHLDRHPELATCPLLLADWQTIEHPEGRTPPPWEAWAGRQTGHGKVPGVRGDCDIDVLRGMP